VEATTTTATTGKNGDFMSKLIGFLIFLGQALLYALLFF